MFRIESMRSKTQLELLRKLRQRRGVAQAFTLVELMIVVAIVGILGAIAIPQFLGARAAANAGAQIGQIVGLSKECAVYQASGGVGNQPSGCVVGVASAFSASWSPTVAGLNCLTTPAGTTGRSAATISVATTGAMTCAFAP